MTTRAQKARNTLEELPFYHTDLEASPVQQLKSRAQGGRETVLATAREHVKKAVKPCQTLDFHIASDIAALQQADPALKTWFDKVSEAENEKQGRPDCLEDATYVVQNGIFYQRQIKAEALALPQSLTCKVMELGLSILWSGHLAFQKSLNRIASRFAWLGIYTHVKDFCASCETSKLT